jgi:hypothetical protein
MRDFGGNNLANHYFAAPVEIDGKRKIVFARARQSDGQAGRFYVHEVFTSSEIENSPAAAGNAPTHPAKAVKGYGAELYKNILRDALAVKPRVLEQTAAPRVITTND